MKKRILSCTLAVALIATTCTVTFAKDDAQTSTVIIEKLEAEIGKMNVPEQERTAILEDLQSAKSGDASKSEKASESLGSRIKNFFKKHWGKVLGIGAAVAAVVIAVATIFTVRHCRNGSNEQEFQTNVSQDSETQEVQNEFQAPTEGTEVTQEIEKSKKYTEQELLTIFTNRELQFALEIRKGKNALKQATPDFQAAKEAAIAAQSLARENANDTMCTEGYFVGEAGGKLDKVRGYNESAQNTLDMVTGDIDNQAAPKKIIKLLDAAQIHYKQGITELKNGGN